jgi:hypothetical protein
LLAEVRVEQVDINLQLRTDVSCGADIENSSLALSQAVSRGFGHFGDYSTIQHKLT